MRLIDADELMKHKGNCYDEEGHLLYAVGTGTIMRMPTIDAVPRQKYEEDMENAFAHGYTDAESDFRKMIADCELVEVVRCKDCIHFDSEDDCECPMDVRYSDFFCKMGERRSDETYRCGCAKGADHKKK